MNASHTFHVRTDTPIKAITLPAAFPGIHVEIGDGLYLHLTTEAAEALQAVLNGALMKAAAIRDANHKPSVREAREVSDAPYETQAERLVA